jgi:hypothetical protein
MHQNFTKEDVILYIYNELEFEKRKGLEDAIAGDSELLAFFQDTMIIMNKLDTVKEEPRGTVLKILSEESRSNSLEIH